MKYRCSHCNHTFELEDREFRRCPSCFWTTSLIPVEKEGEESNSSEVISPTVEKTSVRRLLPKRLIVLLLIISIGFVGAFSFAFFKIQMPIPKLSLKLPFLTAKGDVSKPKLKVPSKQKRFQTAESLLTVEEQAQLFEPFQITIPRKLSEDEEEILKKQASFPTQLTEKPILTIWKKEDFQKLIVSEEEKRKIQFGWGYVRSLTKTFENYYVLAAQAFEQGNYALARELFVKSLSFPVYRNDVKVHRAVALVMLRPYINDVIGKIAVLNQYLLRQSLLSEVQMIYSSYQAIFLVLDLQEWEHTLQLIEELKKQIAEFESRSRNGQMDYLPAFREIDPELQAAIQAEASPKPESAVSLKGLLVDLNLKEKVVRQNIADELLKVQKQYEQALNLVKEGDWQAAHEALQTVEYPPELLEEARKKLALIEKVLTFENAGKK